MHRIGEPQCSGTCTRLGDLHRVEDLRRVREFAEGRDLHRIRQLAQDQGTRIGLWDLHRVRGFAQGWRPAQATHIFTVNVFFSTVNTANTVNL